MEKDKQSGDAASAANSYINPWSRACVERDWDALLAMCNDDMVFMPPGTNAVSGGSMRQWLDSLPTVKAMSWSIARIRQDGDTACLHGPVKQTFTIEGRDEHFDGKYCDVMRRGSDGKWRFSLIIWNSNHA